MQYFIRTYLDKFRFQSIDTFDMIRLFKEMVYFHFSAKKAHHIIEAIDFVAWT